MTAAINEKLLEDRLGALETAQAWSSRVVSRLEALLRSGADQAVFRVNPINSADKGVAEAEAVDLFLHATAQGLFEMNWMLLCSLCGCITESFGSLNRVHDHYHCNLCQTDLNAKLDDYIAVTFTVRRRSAVKFHRPEDLSPQEYCFVYCFAPEGKGPDGRVFHAFIKDATLAVKYLPPGAVTRFGWTSAGHVDRLDTAKRCGLCLYR